MLDRGLTLQEMVAALGVGHGIERSIKVVPGAVWDDRFLLSLYRDYLGSNPLTRLQLLCQAMNMPQGVHDMLLSEIVQARFIHLGYERAGGEVTYKFYLEFPEGFTEPQTLHKGSAPDTERLVHKAYKWSAGSPEHFTVARYYGGSGLSHTSLEGKIRNAYAGRPDSQAAEFPLQLLGLAETRIDSRDLFLLEVEEEGNPRCSFDLNLYPAELKLGDVYSQVATGWRYFSISEDETARVLQPLAGEVFGHLSGGIDRRGGEFCTIYFGARPVPVMRSRA